MAAIVSWPQCLKLDMSTARWRLKSPQSLSGTSAHPTMVTLVNIMVMNGWLRSFSFHVNLPPIPEIKLFQTLTLKLQGQGHGCGQRARSYNQCWGQFRSCNSNSNSGKTKIYNSNSNSMTCNSNSNSTASNSNSNSGIGIGYAINSNSGIDPNPAYNRLSIILTHLLFISHQSDQQFLR